MSGEVPETFEYERVEGTTRSTWKRRIKEFVEMSSFGGILYMFNSKSWIKRIFWATILLTAVAGFFTVTILNILILAKDPFSTSITSTREKELKFPAVTICSLSLLNTTTLGSAAVGIDINNELTGLFADVRDFSNLTRCRQRANALASSTELNISWGELISFAGNDFAMLLRNCTFVGERCTIADFERVLTVNGICYTFNGPKSTRARSVRGTGARQGLRLQISSTDVQQGFSLEEDFGFRVVVHNPDEPPRPESEGIVVSLSSTVYIGMRQVNSMDETTFSSATQCRDDSTPDQDLSFERYGYTTYSPSLCLEACFYKYIISQCNCTENLLYSPLDNRYKLRNCTAPDLCCEVYEFDKVDENCDCPPKCSMIERTLTVSSATNAGGLVGVNVFYESLFLESRKTTDSYTPWSIISDIGGTTGLFLGFTLLSWVELLILVIGIVMDCCGCDRYHAGNRK